MKQNTSFDHFKNNVLEEQTRHSEKQGCSRYLISLEQCIPNVMSKLECFRTKYSCGGHSIWMACVLVILNGVHFTANILILKNQEINGNLTL